MLNHIGANHGHYCPLDGYGSAGVDLLRRSATFVEDKL
jgi:hypothetical protein